MTHRLERSLRRLIAWHVIPPGCREHLFEKSTNLMVYISSMIVVDVEASEAGLRIGFLHQDLILCGLRHGSRHLIQMLYSLSSNHHLQLIEPQLTSSVELSITQTDFKGFDNMLIKRRQRIFINFVD